MTEYTERFLKYHAENPGVWTMFERFALQALSSGRKRLSSKLIFERLRWHYAFETNGDEFKLNNNYTADYARMFLNKHPQYKSFFETRERKTSDLVENTVDSNSQMCFA